MSYKYEKRMKISQNTKKIFVTLGVIFVYRLGCVLPLPGIDYELVKVEKNIEGVAQLLLGPSCYFFALGISPYITASFIVQFLTTFIPQLEKLQQEEGEFGRVRIVQLTRIIALTLSSYEAYSLVFSLREYKSFNFDWSNSFIAQLILILMTGSSVCIWLSEILTEKGLGNGTSIIVLINVVEQFPAQLKYLYQTFSFYGISGKVFLSVILIITFISINFFQALTKEIQIRTSKQFTSKTLSNEFYTVPFRVSQSAVMSIIFSASALYFLGRIGSTLLKSLNLFNFLPLGGLNVITILFNFMLIIFFNVFYSKLTINPRKISENLRKSSTIIPNIQPGKSTEKYLTKILKNVFLVAGIYTGTLVFLYDLAFPNIRGILTSLFIIFGTINDLTYKNRDDSSQLDL